MAEAIIMSVEDNSSESDIVKMAILNVSSIREYGGKYKSIPIYIAVFNGKRLPSFEESLLIKAGCNIEYIDAYADLTHNREGAGLFNRHLCCYHYGLTLLGKYKKLLYVDADVLCLNEIKFTDKDDIVIDTIPPDFLPIDIKEGHYNDIHSLLDTKNISSRFDNYYSLWLSQITKNNHSIWKLWYERFRAYTFFHDNRYSRWESIVFNTCIYDKECIVVDPIEIGGSIPTVDDGFKAEDTWCHYDSFEEDGFLYDVLNKVENDKVIWLTIMLRYLQVNLPVSFEAQCARIEDTKIREELLRSINYGTKETGL